MYIRTANLCHCFRQKNSFSFRSSVLAQVDVGYEYVKGMRLSHYDFILFFLSVRAGAKVVIASNEGNNPAVSRESLSSRFPKRADTNRAVQP